jgi:hypothetical protein
MALDAGILQRLTQGTAADAWSFIIERTLDIASRPLAEGNAPGEVVKRDREIGELDLFLASSGWDLWRCFGQSEISGVERTSDRLARWWAEPSYGNSAARAVLVLDALSLRELPWLLQGAKERDSPCRASQRPPPNYPAKPTSLPERWACPAEASCRPTAVDWHTNFNRADRNHRSAVEGLRRFGGQCIWREELGVLASLARRQAARLRRRPRSGAADQGCCAATF